MNLKVVPDADQRTTPGARNRLLTGFTITVSLLAALAMTAVVAQGGPGARVDLWAVGVLLALTLVGTHGEEVFGDETAINGSMLVVLTSAGIAYAGGPIWVAALCGLAAGLHWHHLRDGAARKILVNTCFTTLSALAAAEVGRALATRHPGVISVVASGLAAVFAYWLTDNVLVALVLAVALGRSVREHARELVRSETEVIPFAVLGFVDGYAFVKVSSWVGVLGAIVLLLVTEVFVFRRGRRGSLRRFRRWAVWSAPVVVTGTLVLTSGVGGVRPVGTLVLISLIGFAGVALLDRVRAGFGLCALVMCVVGAVLTVPTDYPATIAILVGFVSSLGLTIQDRRTPNRLTILSAGALASLALGGVVSALGRPLSERPQGVVLVGIVGAVVAFAAWHATIATAVAFDHGKALLPAAAAVARGEAGWVLAAGLIGAGSGWIGSQWGGAGLATSLVVVLAISRLLIRQSERRDESGGEPALTDDELLDVLRSALLEVPSSPLPD